jgi:hypothetical protein
MERGYAFDHETEGVDIAETVINKSYANIVMRRTEKVIQNSVNSMTNAPKKFDISFLEDNVLANIMISPHSLVQLTQHALFTQIADGIEEGDHVNATSMINMVTKSFGGDFFQPV